MNKKAGKPVFSDNIDELLSEKIIHHSRSNSSGKGMSDDSVASSGVTSRSGFSAGRLVLILLGAAGLFLAAGFLKRYIRPLFFSSKKKKR